MVIDHIAIQVDNIKESVDFYCDEFNSSVIYQDDTWAFLQFDNIKLALVIQDEHPYHIAFEVDTMDDDWPMKGKLHRDGSISKYVEDPSGNKIELIEDYIHNIVFIFDSSFVYNDTNFNNLKFIPIENLGIDGDFIESQAFAYLAIRSFLNLPLSFPKTTRCLRPCSGGILVSNY